MIRVNGVSATVVGVMPEAFRLPGNTDLWLPLAQTPAAMHEAKDDRPVGLISSVKAGLGVSQVNDELNALATRIAQRHARDEQRRPAHRQTCQPAVQWSDHGCCWIAFVGVGGPQRQHGSCGEQRGP